MTPVIEFHPPTALSRDKSSPFLHAVLETLENEVDALHWSVLELNGRANIGSEFVEALENRVEDSNSGLKRTWAELLALAHSLDRLVDGVFVACRTGFFEASDPEGKFDFERCDLALEVNDGKAWRLHVAAPALAERLRTRLQEAGWTLA
ncbi:MAG: hypothetical protein KC466_10860 [Myxococcales bacterium]|nr:hypothetical protein [Myxococcales bacterium]